MLYMLSTDFISAARAPSSDFLPSYLNGSLVSHISLAGWRRSSLAHEAPCLACKARCRGYHQLLSFLSGSYSVSYDDNGDRVARKQYVHAVRYVYTVFSRRPCCMLESRTASLSLSSVLTLQSHTKRGRYLFHS